MIRMEGVKLRNSSFWGERTLDSTTQLGTPGFSIDPYLVAAIVRRQPQAILACLDPNRKEERQGLRVSQLKGLIDYYGWSLLANPVKLALTICDSDTNEMTRGNDATRFDVLHCLAAHWDELVLSAEENGLIKPNLGEVLNYACRLRSHVPLHTFILGLSEDNKRKASAYLHKEYSETAEIESSSVSSFRAN